MHPSICRQFSIASAPVVEAVPLGDGRSHPQRFVSITLTHIESGKDQTVKYDARREQFDKLIETAVLKHFADTSAAKALREQRGLDTVALLPGWSESIGESLHTALRKSCDSRASGYWWNLIHELPTPIFHMLCQTSITQLSAVGDQAPLARYAAALKDAWDKVINQAVDISFEGPYRTTPKAIEAMGWPSAAFEKLTHQQEKNFAAKVKTAYLSLDYLSDDDWRGMLGYLVDYNPAPVTAAATPNG